MSTIRARRTADILTHLRQLRSTLPDGPLLYAISASQHSDPEALTQLLASVKGLSSQSIGCLSTPLPSTSASWQTHTSLSLASFDKRHATLFRSTIPGRKPAQVGRWHAMHHRGKEPDTIDYSRETEMNWGAALSQTYEGRSLPPSLQTLPTGDVESILYFSDNAFEGLSSALESRFPFANKLGLVTASTPFITGRPHTIFYNEEIHSDGAVGLCLASSSKSSSWSAFPGLAALTRPMIVTSTDGNLINAVDNANPSRILLHALQNHPLVASSATQNIPKELQLYLGTLKQQRSSYESDGAIQLDQLFYITSGDPSRGSLALDTDFAPTEGTMVQMFLLPTLAKGDVLDEARKMTRHMSRTHNLTFASISPDELSDMVSRTMEEEQIPGDAGTTILEDTFLAASENGMIVSRAGRAERSWKCVVPGGFVGMRWTTE